MPIWDGKTDEVPLKKVGFGLLLPVEIHYLEWLPKVNGESQTPRELPTREDWLKLEPAKRGKKYIFSVDPSALSPQWTYGPIAKHVTEGFREWQLVKPSIVKAVGGNGKEALQAFAERAATSKWFVEYELVETGQITKQGNPATTFTFLRMTDKLEEAAGWREQRFAKKAEPITNEQLGDAANAWKYSRGATTEERIAKFKTFIAQDEGLKAHESELVELAQAGKLG